MRVLFITRKFPPTTGGMEKTAYKLYTYLKETADVELIKWGGSNRLLFVILPYFLLKAFYILLKRKIDVIYLHDGLLSSIGIMLKIFRTPIAVTIHGLDIMYQNWAYQLVIPRCVSKMNKIICVSEATRKECEKRKIRKEIAVIPWGISDELYIEEKRDIMKRNFENAFRIDLGKKKIVVSVGRLVERKGFHWFVETALPEIVKKNESFYFIVGDGPLKDEIRKSSERSGMEEYVLLLGKIDDNKLKLVYNCADVFVMPNIRVKGDMEGFGIVALEAASCSVPVVASDLEGIRDAVIDGENGSLVEPYSIEKFAEVITELLENDEKREKIGKKAREFTLRNCSWTAVAEQYLDSFGKMGDYNEKGS
jgi:glycosyltransferase involved in cell wall biosynthesis